MSKQKLHGTSVAIFEAMQSLTETSMDTWHPGFKLLIDDIEATFPAIEASIYKQTDTKIVFAFTKGLELDSHYKTWTDVVYGGESIKINLKPIRFTFKPVQTNSNDVNIKVSLKCDSTHLMFLNYTLIKTPTSYNQLVTFMCDAFKQALDIELRHIETIQRSMKSIADSLNDYHTTIESLSQPTSMKGTQS